VTGNLPGKRMRDLDEIGRLRGEIDAIDDQLLELVNRRAELARRIGRPAASRAVGAANGANPLPIVVPCHRVIGKDGSLTGFGGGLPIKRALLELEGAACVAPRGQMRLV